MVFRGFEPGGSEFLRDPVARFKALDEALELSRGALTNRIAQRLAAVNLILTPGDPAELAAAARTLQGEFAARLGMTKAPPSLRLIFAALLLRHGDTADALADEADRVSRMMRVVGLRWGSTFELIATMAMRVHARGMPIPEAQIERMRAIYEAMKVHHWWLTGPEDFPTCALLTTRPGSPEALAGRAHEIYEAIHSELSVMRGDPLQTASNILALADAPPADLTHRFGALMRDFKAAGIKIRADRFDELAVLCFLPRSSAAVVETVVEYDRQLSEHVKWHEKLMTFGFASNLAFIHIVGNDPELGALADVKPLLDIMWIIQQGG
ncbi:hypothetical protein ENSA5_67380 [Enhygromyxa salina]|uniref:Uncharacterized protein n=1 Tax=Enhygromyxa salina TaxID=215803 RepID=A0A2S9XBF0_9BACT|nr:DUF4003 family protein [Enhygromyxa salina]PRP90120.1 hypothetical protein ENSA5_67380 [Enhygromyxa salina]